MQGLGEYIHDTLDTEYYQKLEDELLTYKKVMPKDYIDHLTRSGVS